VRGGAYLANGDLANALANFSRIAKLQPKSPDAHYKLAMLHARNGDLSAARKALQDSLAEDSKYVPARLMLARLYLQENRVGNAIELAQELQRDQPKLLEAILIEANALARDKKTSDALAVLERGMKAAPDSSQIMLAKAQLHWQVQDHDAWLSTVEQWRKAHPSDTDAARYLADGLLSLGKGKDALPVYEEMLKKTPHDAGVLNNLASALTQSDPTRAMQYAEDAYKAAPNNAAIQDTLGWLLVSNGKTERGVELLRKAFEGAPKSADIHFHYATALARSGAKAEAKRELQRLIESSQDGAKVAAAKELLQSL
jgi:putative PEP-CTERM system TPR-repeat lipoprotein